MAWNQRPPLIAGIDQCVGRVLLHRVSYIYIYKQTVRIIHVAQEKGVAMREIKKKIWYSINQFCQLLGNYHLQLRNIVDGNRRVTSTVHGQGCVLLLFKPDDIFFF